jgi:H/ACA ribonucleoprotein complex subunit 1
MHECESEMVCKLSHTTGMIPYFNASIYLENKKKIGKVDEIFGPIQKVMFTVSYFQIRIIIFRCWIVTRI